LEGKIVSLPKPLAVLQRVRAPPVPDPCLARDGNEDVDMRHLDEREADVAGSIAAPTTSYAIRTLVRKKLVFSKRPTPIVGLSAKNINNAMTTTTTATMMT
jgi:chromosome transmission fidelity protein 8